MLLLVKGKVAADPDDDGGGERERESKTQVSARVREHLDGRLWSDLLGWTLTGHWTLTATLITATSATSVY